jgi:protein-disulfide isomerase
VKYHVRQPSLAGAGFPGGLSLPVRLPRTLPLFAVLLLAACNSFAAGTDIMEGNPSSSVKVLIYEDLQCSDCATFGRLLDDRILPKYGARVAFIHRDFPLGKHEWARPAAIAARWVYEKDPRLGLTIRRELLSEQNNISLQTLKSWLTEFAARNHLEARAIVSSIDDPRLGALVDQDRQAAIARGIVHTPTVFVGGVPFVETIIYEDLARALDDALSK